MPLDPEPHVGDIERYRSVHMTDDGPIFGKVWETADRKWFARHWGDQLDGGLVCDSYAAALSYLRNSFRQMFPEHECGEGCKKSFCLSAHRERS